MSDSRRKRKKNLPVKKQKSPFGFLSISIFFPFFLCTQKSFLFAHAKTFGFFPLFLIRPVHCASWVLLVFFVQSFCRRFFLSCAFCFSHSFFGQSFLSPVFSLVRFLFFSSSFIIPSVHRTPPEVNPSAAPPPYRSCVFSSNLIAKIDSPILYYHFLHDFPFDSALIAGFNLWFTITDDDSDLPRSFLSRSCVFSSYLIAKIISPILSHHFLHDFPFDSALIAGFNLCFTVADDDSDLPRSFLSRVLRSNFRENGKSRSSG